MSRRDWVRFVRSNPDWALRELDAIEAEDRLLAFIRLVWPVLHPERKLVEGWALAALCDHLEAVADGRIRKLLVNVPPGCMKSLAVNVFLPAWLWGPRARPSLQIISWSYAEQLTIRDNRRFRTLVTSDLYQSLWGDRFRLAGDQNEKRLLENDALGFKLASGIHGGGTGHRGDLLIWDDPHKVKEAESDARREDANQWLTETFPTRKNDDQAVAVGIMQRVHERDCSGTVLAAPGRMGYDHLCLPMEHEADHPHPSATALGFRDPRREGELLWPERFSRTEVEEMKLALRSWGGHYAEAGQLQQRPAPRGGGMFRRRDLAIVDEPPECAWIARGWDLAATSSKRNPDAAFTAAVKLGLTRDRRVVFLDVRRLQGSAHEVEELIQQTAGQDGRGRVVQDFPQDPGQAGVAQKNAIARLLLGHQVHFSPETGSKPDRARPLAAQAEAGNVLLVRAAWNDPFIAEAEVFPNGRYLDQVDAASRAFARLLLLSQAGADQFATPELYVGGG